MEYKAAYGSPLTDKQAQRYGEFLEALAEENNGSLSAEDVLQNAHASSPIHDYFEWDDSEAAQRYRMVQARELLRFIEVIIERDGVQEQVRAFHNVHIVTDKTSERVYAPLVRILSDDDLRHQVIEGALRELNSWKKRYKQYHELKPVFAVIDTLKEQVSA